MVGSFERYVSCNDELAQLQADSVVKKHFQLNASKKFRIVKGHADDPRLAKHAVSGYSAQLSETAFSTL